MRFMLVPSTKMENSGSGSDVEPLGANKLHLFLVLSLFFSLFSFFCKIFCVPLYWSFLEVNKFPVRFPISYLLLFQPPWLCSIWPHRAMFPAGFSQWEKMGGNQRTRGMKTNMLLPGLLPEVASLVESRTEPIGTWTLCRVQEVQEDSEKRTKMEWPMEKEEPHKPLKSKKPKKPDKIFQNTTNQVLLNDVEKSSKMQQSIYHISQVILWEQLGWVDEGKRLIRNY